AELLIDLFTLTRAAVASISPSEQTIVFFFAGEFESCGTAVLLSNVCVICPARNKLTASTPRKSEAKKTATLKKAATLNCKNLILLLLGLERILPRILIANWCNMAP